MTMPSLVAGSPPKPPAQPALAEQTNSPLAQRLKALTYRRGTQAAALTPPGGGPRGSMLAHTLSGGAAATS
jgi:hypothetical protein